MKESINAEQLVTLKALKAENARAADLIAAYESCMDGCRDKSWLEWQNGHGENVGKRIEAARKAYFDAAPAQTSRAEVRNAALEESVTKLEKLQMESVFYRDEQFDALSIRWANAIIARERGAAKHAQVSAAFDAICEYLDARFAALQSTAAIESAPAQVAASAVPEGYALIPTDINSVVQMGWKYLDEAREESPMNSGLSAREIMELWEEHRLHGEASDMPFLRVIVGFARAMLVQRPTDEQLWDQTLQERDHYHDMADRLADQIAAITATDIGEHSSSNCPWNNALLAVEEYWTLAARPTAVMAGGLSPAAPAPKTALTDETILTLAAPFCADEQGFARKPELFEIVAFARAVERHLIGGA